MDIAEILRNLLIVLVAAKAAAEISERIGIPAVVGEIVAGILIGPSLLERGRRGRRGAAHPRRDRRDPPAARRRAWRWTSRSWARSAAPRCRSATVGVDRAAGPRPRRHVEHGRGVQHRALRRRRPHRDERGHHRPGLRRPPCAGHRTRHGSCSAPPSPTTSWASSCSRSSCASSPRDRCRCCRSSGSSPWPCCSSSSGSVVGPAGRPAAVLRHRPRLAVTGHARRDRLRVHAGVRGAGRPGPAGPDRRRLRRRHRAVQGRPVGADPAGAHPGRPPLHPGVLPPDRHRRRHHRPSGAARCSATPRSSSWWPWSGSCCRRSARSAPPGDKPLIGLGMLPRGEVGPDLRHHRAAERRARRRPLRRPAPRGAGHHAGHAAAAEGPVPPAARGRPARGHAERHPATRGRVAPGRARDEVGLAARPPDDAGRAAGARGRRSTSPAGDRPRSSSTGSPTRCPTTCAWTAAAHLQAPRRDRAGERAIVAVPRDHRCARRRAARAGQRLPPAGRRHLLARRLAWPRLADDAAAAPARRGRPALDRGAGARQRGPAAARRVPRRGPRGRARPRPHGQPDPASARSRPRGRATSSAT